MWICLCSLIRLINIEIVARDNHLLFQTIDRVGWWWCARQCHESTDNWDIFPDTTDDESDGMLFCNDAYHDHETDEEIRERTAMNSEENHDISHSGLIDTKASFKSQQSNDSSK